MKIPEHVYQMIRDGEYGLFFGDNLKEKTAWVRSFNRGGIISMNWHGKGASHEEALTDLNNNLKDG